MTLRSGRLVAVPSRTIICAAATIAVAVVVVVAVVIAATRVVTERNRVVGEDNRLFNPTLDPVFIGRPDLRFITSLLTDEIHKRFLRRRNLNRPPTAFHLFFKLFVNKLPMFS